MSQKQNKFRRFFSSELFLGIILFTGYLIYHSIKTHRDNNWTQARIEKKFSKNLVLVKHEYAIKLVFHDPKEEPMFFVKKEDGSFDKWEKGVKANFVMGAGFITSKNGDCITSANIANPLPEDGSWDNIALSKAAHFFMKLFKVRSEGYYEIFTISIGYYPANSSIDDSKTFVGCKSNGYYDGGIYELVVNNPDKAGKSYTGFSRARYKGTLPKDEKLFVLGLPADMNPDKKITAVSGVVTVDSSVSNSEQSNQWYELYLRLPSYFMLEGSPVFNRKGNIIGVMTAGTHGYKAFFTLLER